MSGRMLEGVHDERVIKKYVEVALAMQVTELGRMERNTCCD